MKKIINQICQRITPCKKCPYKLGLVKTTVNPCPQCRLNNYEAFDKFNKKVMKRDRCCNKSWNYHLSYIQH